MDSLLPRACTGGAPFQSISYSAQEETHVNQSWVSRFSAGRIVKETNEYRVDIGHTTAYVCIIDEPIRKPPSVFSHPVLTRRLD